MWCTMCGAQTHTAANCPHTCGGSVNRAHMRCTYCGGRNHAVEACPHTYGGSVVRATNPDLVADYFVKDK